MQQFPHRESTTNTPLLVAAAGLGALLAYALSTPQRRAAMVAAGHTALDAGSRLASSSAERLREWVPEARESWDRLMTRAGSAAEEAAPSAADRLHHAADVAGESVRRAAGRARALAAQARYQAHDTWDGLHDSSSDHADGRTNRASVLGPIVAAAALGASLYAMRRHDGSGQSDQPGRDVGGARESGQPVGSAPHEAAH